jgi:hypothetical protein
MATQGQGPKWRKERDSIGSRRTALLHEVDIAQGPLTTRGKYYNDMVVNEVPQRDAQDAAIAILGF